MDKTMTWKPGECGGSVVSEAPCATCHQGGNTGHADTAHYGGYLVAESIPPELIPLISNAPTLLDGCKMALYMFSQLDILPQAFPATKVHLEQLVAKAEVTTNAPTCG